MKLIHTSDWHWGGRLHDQERAAEHEALADWLLELLRRERPDVLLMAGDIFDTGAPSNRAQEGYFNLLARVYREALCQQVVVIGGNHDSPTLLEAPARVLSQLRVWVVGETHTEAPEREVVLVAERDGRPGLAIAAVPYLREGDLRRSEPGEEEADRQSALREGLRRHYALVAARARERARAEAGRELPLVLAGHLYLTGAALSDDRSERALRLGNLGAMARELLPAADYYALGHLHTPQAVGGDPACRYSGSPLPLSFAEAGQAKSVTVVELGPRPGEPPVVHLEPVPVFQRLEVVRGSPERIRERLGALVAAGGEVWVEVQVTEGEGDLTPFWGLLPGLVAGSPVRLLAHQNCRPAVEVARARELDGPGLEQLSPADVFRLRLADAPDLPREQQARLEALFAEALKSVEEADTRRA